MNIGKLKDTDASAILARFAIACTGIRARVAYSRTFPDQTKPQTGRLNKSPHTLHAIANRHNSTAARYEPVLAATRLRRLKMTTASSSGSTGLATCI